MTVYIYSTLTCDNAYTLYEPSVNDIKRPSRVITVKGGSNVADKRLVTPNGVITPVSEADYEILKNNREFQNHVDRGYVKINRLKTDPEKIARDLEEKDKSAPITPDFYMKNNDVAKPEKLETASPAPIKRRGRPAKK